MMKTSKTGIAMAAAMVGSLVLTTGCMHMGGKEAGRAISAPALSSAPRVNPSALILGDYAYSTNAAGQAAITGFNRRYSGPLTMAGVLGGCPVTGIGGSAFGQCEGLTSITIPAGVTNIGDYAFTVCPGLTGITVNARNAFYSSADGVLFNKSRSALIECPKGKSGSYIIPGSVTRIGDFAFTCCARLTSITIPRGVTRIGTPAFAWCRELASITIPDSITNIGSEAFLGCVSLTNVTIGAGVTSIGDRAFAQCPGLAGVTIPGSVTRIGEGAFLRCSRLAHVEIPAGVTSVGGWAFWGCSNLAGITIPAGVTNIGEHAFCNCHNLTAITVDGANADYSSVDGVLFNKNQTTLIHCPGGKAGNYVIPAGVTTVGKDAFRDCKRRSASVRSPQSRQLDDQAHVQRVPEQPKPPAVSKYTEVESQKHLEQYQMELIRAGGEKGPPLPMPMTPEMDAQLVKEGVLPSLEKREETSETFTPEIPPEK